MDTTELILTDIEDDPELPIDEAILLARIPIMAGSNKKMAYLSYRSTGFTVTQSADLAGVNIKTVHKWRRLDPDFARFEGEELQRLQTETGNDVIRFEFLRNMRMLLRHDMKLISRALNDVDKISPREFELFKNVRKYYTPQDMLALEKILNPEKHRDTPITIKLSWGTRQLGAGAIEGDYREVPDGDTDTE